MEVRAILLLYYKERERKGKIGRESERQRVKKRNQMMIVLYDLKFLFPLQCLFKRYISNYYDSEIEKERERE